MHWDLFQQVGVLLVFIPLRIPIILGVEHLHHTCKATVYSILFSRLKQNSKTELVTTSK